MIRIGVEHEGPGVVVSLRDDVTGRACTLTLRRVAHARAASDLLAGRARDPDEEAESECALEGTLETS